MTNERDTDQLLMGFLAWRAGSVYGPLGEHWITFDPYGGDDRRVCGVCNEFFSHAFDSDDVKIAKTRAHRAQHVEQLTGERWDGIRAALAAGAVDLACELLEDASAP